jgi:hypothetical protein
MVGPTPEGGWLAPGYREPWFGEVVLGGSLGAMQGSCLRMWCWCIGLWGCVCEGIHPLAWGDLGLWGVCEGIHPLGSPCMGGIPFRDPLGGLPLCGGAF